MTKLRSVACGIAVPVAVCICSLIAAAGASASTLPSTGPANSKAQVELCTDFLQLQQPSPADSSTAYATLIAQNGSIAATITYCQALVG
jgi:hypothetical protein